MKKPKRKVTALAVRRRAPIARLVPTSAQAVFPGLPSEPVMVANFVGTLTLTKKQIDALRRPVGWSEIEWKAAVKDGPPVIPYMSHNGYRDRLDAAFGLGGWGMVPVGQPKANGDFVYVPFAMVIGGVPRLYAWGEQQIHRMTYGDALEGCKSNAILRCGKELGIARELWNRAHIETLLKRKQTSPADGKTRASSPARNEGYHAREDEPITQGQRQRLAQIVKSSGRVAAEISMWLKAAYGLDSSKDITRRDYDAVCAAVERPGALPMPRDPGEDG